MLLIALSLPAYATGTAELKGDGSVVAGKNIEFVINISGCGDASSASVDVSFSDKFEFVSGEWLKAGSVSGFFADTKKGALGGLSSPDINGSLFKLTLKAIAATAEAQSVSVTVTAKNGGTEIFNSTASKSVKITCANHSYSPWSSKDSTKHQHSCTVCGTVEESDHAWDSGTVTKAATCAAAGSRTYTCTVCNASRQETIAKTDAHSYGSWTTTKEAACTAAGTKTRTCSVCKKVETAAIAALGHSFSKATVTKEATCTETGVETGKCTRCGQTTTNVIKAKGHKFGSWAEKTAATCTAGGTEERKCPVCSSVETRSTEALGHDFENPVIVREATISATGLMEGKCRRCSETTQQVIPCTATDAGTGTVFEAEEGVFADGASIKVVEVADGAGHTSAQSALADVTSSFQLVDISALVDGTEVQPGGKVKVTFAKPEDFGSNVGLYHISDDAVATRLEAVVSDDGTTITVEVDSFGTFAVCDLDGGMTEPEGTGSDGAVSAEPDGGKQETDGSGSPVLWIVLGLAAVLAAAGVILYFVKKKHRR